ncbi:FxsB family radical SAM/SPASM domain protein [Streptomyces sp. ISL-98]|uniref:radical SAM/SPASM protein FxsBH, inactivated beta-hydroxylase extension form n=1 Tax=Streptomyces sp. ISL-98 TaxID=2819192 RepID=UPI001BE990A2|nr:radical SAM/SPASM protein FxsB, inactivated metallohydrolase extension form [Streptomyces sp. ISL-98]MBT2508277.1 FxsB family radical SAM/SPASM domain protein [Streptomyces sp. ISL-98]
MAGSLIPFRAIVLKVHSRCDLACDHCYVYEHADQSWRTRPRTLSDETVSQVAHRLAEHVKSHALDAISVILHGGEPLLAGPERLRRICAELTEALTPVTTLDLRIHTNGLRLDARCLDLFAEYGVRVGVSLDGDRAANDRHRRHADGRSSHPQVVRAVELLRSAAYRHLYLGLLCTVDVANDPVAVLDALAALDPPRVDFLLPHATWDTPPDRPGGSPTAYADWLLAAHGRWEELGRPMEVRLFASVESTLGGGPSLTEVLGLTPTDLVVVETDGMLEQADSLKTAYDGAAATGFDVFTHSLDEVAAHPGIRARQLGLAGVSGTCRRCPVVRSCGGGLYAHRHRTGTGFDNPSAYCTDLKALVRGIEERTPTSAVLLDSIELAVQQRQLTRTLLAHLNVELDGRGGRAWDEAWELAAEVETRSDALDDVLAHPYARTWLLRCLEALDEGRPEALANDLGSYVAAAAVRGGLALSVPVNGADGTVHLPTLGTLRVRPGCGRTEVRAAGDGFAVRQDGTESRITDWRPVRRSGGLPGLALDDTDPYRDCYETPARPRLTDREASALSSRLTDVWAELRETVPAQAEEAAAALATLTPLTAGPVRAGRHGYGALGIPASVTAPGLLRGFRRAKLRALHEVTDLFHRDIPRDTGRLRLLADTYERVGVAAYLRAGGAGQERLPRLVAGTGRALETLESPWFTAQLTLNGGRLVAALREEWERDVER